MKTQLLKNSLLAVALFAATFTYAQTVSGITLVSTGSAGSVTTTDPVTGDAIDLEAGGTLEATFTVSTVPATMEPVQRTFSVAKYTTLGTNIFNADNSNQFTYAAQTYSESFTRTFTAPAEGSPWPGNSGTNVIVGEQHKLILNGKRWIDDGTGTGTYVESWGTSTEVFLNIVSAATLSTNNVSQNNKLSLYLSNGKLNVQTTQISDFKIYNITGSVVIEGKATQSIDVSRLSSGLYIYKSLKGFAKFVK